MGMGYVNNQGELENTGDSVQSAGPTPVLKDPVGLTSGMGEGLMGASADALADASGSAPAQQGPPAPPTQKPVFFQKLLGSLGLGLVNAVRAGLETPLGPNAFGQAATTAYNLPEQDKQVAAARKTALAQQQADQQKAELQTKYGPEKEQTMMAQLHLNILHTMANLRQMNQEYQFGATNAMASSFSKMAEEGDVEYAPNSGITDNFEEAQ